MSSSLTLSFLLLLACVPLCVRSLRPAPVHAFLGSTPTLDGVISPSEWADASHFASGIQTWDPEFAPVLPPAPGARTDLDVQGWVKHDGTRLFFAFAVTDNLLYRLEEPSWTPAGNAAANNLTRTGWPWFGDEIELLLNAPNTWSSPEEAPSGVPGVWQMAINAQKSRLGGMGVGGLLEGEPLSSDTAWGNMQEWIYSRAMEAAVSVTPQRGGGDAAAWSCEFAADFNPTVQLAPGVWWNTSHGAVGVGFNVALGDVDTEAEGNAHFGLRHEMWWAGNASASKTSNAHTWLSQLATLVLEPGVAV